MMKSSLLPRSPQLLPLTPFLLLHRLRNPLPHRMTNPLRPPCRIPHRDPLRHPRRILLSLTCRD